MTRETARTWTSSVTANNLISLIKSHQMKSDNLITLLNSHRMMCKIHVTQLVSAEFQRSYESASWEFSGTFHRNYIISVEASAERTLLSSFGCYKLEDPISGSYRKSRNENKIVRAFVKHTILRGFLWGFELIRSIRHYYNIILYLTQWGQFSSADAVEIWPEIPARIFGISGQMKLKFWRLHTLIV